MPAFQRSAISCRALAGCLTLGAVCAAAGTAAAATTEATLMVSATVDATCAVSANPLNFGSYSPGGGTLNANTTLAVLCTRGAAFTVAMDAGMGGGTVAQRLMTSGTSKLQYNLYTSAARTTVWGDGTISSAMVAGLGKGLARVDAITETVYGQLPDNAANRNIAPGVYTDTIHITVSY